LDDHYEKRKSRKNNLVHRYFLTICSFQPLYGKLSDTFGCKAALLFAYSVFGLGSLCCGLARNISELIAARALAGMGGGADDCEFSCLS
jgi:MFS family permease